MRIATAFPPLVDDIVGFLVQLGRICMSQSCLNGSYDYRIVNTMLRQVDRQSMDDDQSNAEPNDNQSEQSSLVVFAVDPTATEVKMELKEPKKEAEEGEIEEGELPEIKVIVQPTCIASLATLKTSSDHVCRRARANSAKLRELFKILPEASVMGAEVYRTFSLLCDQAILRPPF